MKETLLATYERESTLWKNANAFYKAQDWTKMECLFFDFSDNRKDIEEIGMRFHTKTGEDITEDYVKKCYSDRYAIRLTNKSGKSHKCFEFNTKEEANEMFKEIFNHKILVNWHKVN